MGGCMQLGLKTRSLCRGVVFIGAVHEKELSPIIIAAIVTVTRREEHLLRAPECTRAVLMSIILFELHNRPIKWAPQGLFPASHTF